MSNEYAAQLPDIFPRDEILVEGEQHHYETYEGKSGSVLEETKYTLDKGPVFEITEVTGVHEAQTITFTQGSDYSLEDLVHDHTNKFTFEQGRSTYTLDNAPDAGSTTVIDASADSYTAGVDYEIFDPDDIEADTIRWLDGGASPADGEDFTVTYTVAFENSIIEWDTNQRTPDAGTVFHVSYRCDSVISRYVAASNEQFASIDEELDAVIEGKFIDSAEGDGLDELGKLFGVLGERSGRSDAQYRTYLKSVVQSFISRGTVDGIKLAVSSATDVPFEDITIIEDFENNEYDVGVIPTTQITGSLIEEVAEIADPSGVEQSATRFVLDPEQNGIGESVSTTEGQQIADEAGAADTAVNFGFGTEGAVFEKTDIDAVVGVDANTDTTLDTLLADETVGIDDNETVISAGMALADEVINVEPLGHNDHKWEEDNDVSTTRWNFSEWAGEETITLPTTDTVFAGGAVNIPPKDAVLSESLFSDDSVDIRFEEASVTDTGGSDDAVTSTTESSVVWETNSWGGFNWGGSVED